MARLRPLCAAAVTAACVSMISAPVAAAQTAAPAPTSPEAWAARLDAEGERNRVLNQMEVGARSFWAAGASPQQAASALDDAIGNIETVFADDKTALKARSVWYEEGAKTFKGEPYERAMVYLYRGLLYLRAGDYENARASFRNGQLQDAFAEEDQNRTDFAVLLFLDAWASHLNGDADLRDETLVRLKQLRPDFPGIGPKDDTLVFAETGTAPRKLGNGASHAYFVYRRGKGFTESRAELVRGDKTTGLYPMEDIYWQAATRGGREIDKILNGKVQFRTVTGGIGSALADTSVALSDAAAYSTSLGESAGSLGDVGAALGGIGAVSLLVAANAKPRADTRAWTSLPDTVHVLTFSSKAQPGDAAVRFVARDGATVGEDRPIAFERDPNGGRSAFVRSR